ncbi:MAG: helix-turn-helix transcriptional regulator [Akkermansia sp.]
MKKGQNIIGQQVRSKRISLGLSQNKLAMKCQLKGWQLSRETLSKIESGLRCVTDAEAFFLADILECTVDALMKAPLSDILFAMRHSRDRDS